jgi:hypothetical protein
MAKLLAFVFGNVCIRERVYSGTCVFGNVCIRERVYSGTCVFGNVCLRDLDPIGRNLHGPNPVRRPPIG